MDWDHRTTSFLSGETALAYCWTVRAARFENDISSAVKRKVSYLPQPRGPGGVSNNPIGGFLLCIPSNLPEDRIERAFEAIAWMTSPEAMKANVQNGFPVAPRFSVSADPEAAATSPIVSVVDRLAKRNLLKGWPRPPVPEYLSLEAILGEEIHSGARWRGLGSSGAQQCAGGSRQRHARAGIISGPACDRGLLPRPMKVGHVYFGHIPARPIARPCCNSGARPRRATRSASGRGGGQKDLRTSA
jgi:hypothetical protein